MATISVTAFLTPFLAYLGSAYIYIKQIVEGIAIAFTFPTVNAIMGKWLHPSDKALWAPITNSGLASGTIFAFFGTGLLAESAFGWPGMFYISGFLCTICFLGWIFFGANSPSDVQKISEEESKYLKSIPGTTSIKLKSPWKSIFTSKPVISIAICQFAYGWNYVLLQTAVPTYNNEILKLSLKAVSKKIFLHARILLLLFLEFYIFIFTLCDYGYLNYFVINTNVSPHSKRIIIRNSFTETLQLDWNIWPSILLCDSCFSSY